MGGIDQQHRHLVTLTVTEPFTTSLKLSIPSATESRLPAALHFLTGYEN